MHSRIRCLGGRILVTVGALWLATFFCVVATHQPRPGADVTGALVDTPGLGHRAWHHHSVRAGDEYAGGPDLDSCALCVARAGFRGVAATTSLSHPAGGHGQEIPLVAISHGTRKTPRRPPTRGPPHA